jgi:hypothetical protein
LVVAELLVAADEQLTNRAVTDRAILHRVM